MHNTTWQQETYGSPYNSFAPCQTKGAFARPCSSEHHNSRSKCRNQTCTTIVGPTMAETRPTGSSTSSGSISMLSGSTAGGRMPCSLQTHDMYEAQ